MAAACAAVVTPAAAQSPDDIARRVAAAPDGSVQMTFAARPDVCGDGQNMIRSGQTITVYPSMIGRGRSDSPCDVGPLRVVLTVQGGEIAGIRTHVGRARARTPAAPITDLGTVSAPVASRSGVI
jgi:hypothetical protein